MSYAICTVPVAPVRLSADHRVEMTSQLLFGETGTIVGTAGKEWLLIKNNWDGHEGWCRSNQFVITEALPGPGHAYCGDWINLAALHGNSIRLPFGSGLNSIPVEYTGNIVQAGRMAFSPKNIKEVSAVFLNTAYLWGGKSVFGIDCSGFVQSVFRMMNIPLLRDVALQATQGEPVGFLQEAVCGDLAFFDELDVITHVGILLSDHEIIHASGNVRIDTIDHQGIIHAASGLRTHRLRLIKRIA